MPETDEAVRALLHAAADPPGGPLIPPTDAVLLNARRRLRRRRGGLLSGVALVVAVVVAVPVVLAGPSHDRRSTPADPSPSVSASLDPTLGTVAALAKDHWSTLPPAPIVPRTGGAVVWTGHEMLIWGGGDQDKAPADLRADGATYDPVSRQWRTTSASPLSPRYDPAFVWTGSELFIWGGSRAGPLHASAALSDGALYNPDRRTWRTIPAAPLPKLGAAQAVFVNGTVLVIGRSPGQRAISVYAADFDPKTEKWRRLPDLPTVPGDQRFEVKVAATASDAYVLAYNSTRVSGHNRGFTFNVDTFWLSGTSVTWHRLASSPDPFPASPPLIVGGRIVVPAGEPAVLAPEPMGFVSGGRSLLPTAPSWSPLVIGPIDHGYPDWASTGSALIGLVPAKFTNYPGDATPSAGSAAVWDPATRRWTSLSPAPLDQRTQLAVSAEVWTGRELLIWGGSGDASTDSPLLTPVGFSFGPSSIGTIQGRTSTSPTSTTTSAGNAPSRPATTRELGTSVMFHGQLPVYLGNGEPSAPQPSAMEVFVVDATTTKPLLHVLGGDSWS